MSLFPMARYGLFARVTCASLQDSGQEMGKARLFESEGELKDLLLLGFSSWETDRLLREVEAGEITQMAIDDATARRLGFQQMIH